MSPAPAAGLTAEPVGLDQLPPDPDRPFLQEAFWARHKMAFGWQSQAFRVGLPDGRTDHVVVLHRPVGRLFRFAYVPHARFGLDGSALLELSRLIRRHVGGLLFVRWDPYEGPDDLAPLAKAAADVQPPDTVVVDLAGGAEAVLAAMKPKTRYNARLAEKKGVTVEAAGPERLGDWYALYRETAERDRIALHSEEYYRRLLADNPERTELLLASHEGELLAGNIMLYQGRHATYLYGASSNNKRNLMPTYLLQWRGMERSMARGCTDYDLFGIPPSDDPDHPMHGLYQFKTGFGGSVVRRPGCWDAPTSPWYGLYRFAEQARAWYFKRWKKR